MLTAHTAPDPRQPAATRITDVLGDTSGEQFLLRVSVLVPELGGWHRLYFGPLCDEAAARAAGDAVAAAADSEVVFSVEPLRPIPDVLGRLEGRAQAVAATTGGAS